MQSSGPGSDQRGRLPGLAAEATVDPHGSRLTWSNVCPGQYECPKAARLPAAAVDFGSCFKTVVRVHSGPGDAAERAVCCRERVPAFTHAHTHA